jgi:glycosyltransferase involved in cell wall biosynthesis
MNSMVKPRFSVIIPTLNEEKFLPKLLASLAIQTDKDFEVIVVDGLSKDKTIDVANSFSSKLPHLQVAVSKKASLPLQRNLGAKYAQGEWLVFVDADSIFMPYFIDRIRVFITTTQPKVFFTWALPDSDSVHDAIFTLLTNIGWESNILFNRPVTPGPLTIIRKDIYNSFGGYNETQAFNEDVEFGLRLAKNGIMLTVLRETLYVWSMRRFRREGKMKVMNQQILSMIPIIFFRRPFKVMPGYIMGGHLYDKKKRKIKLSALKKYKLQLDKLMKKLIEEFTS